MCKRLPLLERVVVLVPVLNGHLVDVDTSLAAVRIAMACLDDRAGGEHVWLDWKA